MKIYQQHEWQVSTSRALEIQQELAPRVIKYGKITGPRYIAGIDVAVNRIAGSGTAALVVVSYPGLEPVEIEVVTGKIEFPYVPGMLSFRESPLALAAYEKLKISPDLVIVDGQGIAHPRRMGLASHLGILLDRPAIGCAKSRLCGTYELPGDEPGSYSDLVDDGEIIGAVLRTKTGSKPVYVSIGHKLDLPAAIQLVMACCRGYRLPEPARLAHLAAGGNLKPIKALVLEK